MSDTLKPKFPDNFEQATPNLSPIEAGSPAASINSDENLFDSTSLSSSSPVRSPMGLISPLIPSHFRRIDPLGINLPFPTQKIPTYSADQAIELGRGAFGSASVVTPNQGAPFVIKTMYPGRLAAKESGAQSVGPKEILEYRSRMEAEPKILNYLAGIPGVPRFIGSDISHKTQDLEIIENPVTIAMEYISAPSLAKKKLDEDATKSVLRQLLTTLDAAHQRGVGHFDVKPANILWDGQKMTLIDWGQARFFDPTKAKMSDIPPGTERYRPGFNFEERGDEPIPLEAFSVGITCQDLLDSAAKKSPGAKDFIKRCLTEDPPANFSELLKHPWLNS
jgi:serine/threonine protein kinase